MSSVDFYLCEIHFSSLHFERKVSFCMQHIVECFLFVCFVCFVFKPYAHSVPFMGNFNTFTFIVILIGMDLLMSFYYFCPDSFVVSCFFLPLLLPFFLNLWFSTFVFFDFFVFVLFLSTIGFLFFCHYIETYNIL